MNIDYKSVFISEQKYNSLLLFEASIYDNLITIYTELENHNNKELLKNELDMVMKFFKLNSKYGNYNFCGEHLHSKYDGSQLEEKMKLSEANLKDLFSALFDKMNLLVDDFMSIVEYNPNRVSFNNKTSVFLIAYATDLKELWESFNETFMEELVNKDIENKVFREDFMKEKLKFVPLPGAKGVWAKPLKI